MFTFIKHHKAAIIWLVFVSYVSYSITDTEPPVQNITYSTERVGENLKVTWNQGVINRQCSGVAYRNITTNLDDNLYSITLRPTAFSKIIDTVEKFPIYNDSWSIAVDLDGTFPAIWKYKVHVDYSCNLIQKLFPFTVEWPTVEFFIE